MKEEFSADYKSIEDLVNEFLIKFRSIKGFPLDYVSLINEIGNEAAIALLPFSWLEEHGAKPEEVIESKDAETKELNGRYIIFYNQQMPPSRILFSILHEIAHILLGHDLDLIKEYRKTGDSRFMALYDRYEKEANHFSSCFMMPRPVLNRLCSLGCCITSDFLKTKFGASGEAAAICIKALQKNSTRSVSYWDKDKSLEQAVVMKFSDFIKKTAPRQKSYEEEGLYEERMQRERDSWIAEGC